MKRTVTSMALILLLTCAGCSSRSGSDSGGDAAGNSSAPTTGQAAAGTPTTAAQNPAGQPGGTPQVQPGIAPPEIARIFDRARSGQAEAFTASYRLTNVVSGIRKTSTWRLAQQPPRFRFERLSGGARDVWVFDGKVLHTCTRTGGRLRCLESTLPDDPSAFGTAHPGALIDQLSSLTPLIGAGMSVKTATRTVAGHKLDCAVFTSAAPSEPEKLLCLTGDGVIGYARLGPDTLALTSLRQGVRSRDFVAPA